MASFTDDEVVREALDWVILRDGGIALYWRASVLEADLQQLRTRDYEVKDIDASLWLTEEAMHEALAVELRLPAYYGRNLDALDDSLVSDLQVSRVGGLVIVLRHYDKAVERDVADVVLDILAKACRCHMLQGERLLVLVQSDDPQISFRSLGAVGAVWNYREYLTTSRKMY